MTYYFDEKQDEDIILLSLDAVLHLLIINRVIRVIIVVSLFLTLDNKTFLESTNINLGAFHHFQINESFFCSNELCQQY